MRVYTYVFVCMYVCMCLRMYVVCPCYLLLTYAQTYRRATTDTQTIFPHPTFTPSSHRYQHQPWCAQPTRAHLHWTRCLVEGEGEIVSGMVRGKDLSVLKSLCCSSNAKSHSQCPKPVANPFTLHPLIHPRTRAPRLSSPPLLLSLTHSLTHSLAHSLAH